MSRITPSEHTGHASRPHTTRHPALPPRGSAGRILVLNIATAGLYSFVWFYRVWTYLREVGRVALHPGWLVVALAIPGLGTVAAYRCFSKISELGREARLSPAASPVVSTTVLTIAWLGGSIALNPVGMLPVAIALGGGILVLGTLPLASAQQTLNALWAMGTK